jgi:hypothetical protein
MSSIKENAYIAYIAYNKRLIKGRGSWGSWEAGEERSFTPASPASPAPCYFLIVGNVGNFFFPLHFFDYLMYHNSYDKDIFGASWRDRLE